MEKNNIFSKEVFDDGSAGRGKRKFLPRFFFAIFIIYILFFLVFFFLYMSFKATFVCVPVQGISMKNTINSSANSISDVEDWVYIREAKEYKRGDIIVFSAKYDKSLTLIKRLIALEGDAVTIAKDYDENSGEWLYYTYRVNSELLKDGVIDDGEVEKLDEPYIRSQQEWTHCELWTTRNGIDYEGQFYQTFLSGDYKTLTYGDMKFAVIPQGEFFYMGDNRTNSTDSRAKGTDYFVSIDGVAEIIVKDAETSNSALLVQVREVFKYYGEEIGKFFVRLWNELLQAFAI